MAQRRRTATVSRGPGGLVVVSPPAAAPVVRRRSSGGRRRRRRGGRRRSSGAHSSSNIQQTLTGVAIGGLAYGLLVKNWPQLPRLPGIGRSGTVALTVAFLKPQNQILRNIGIAAAAIAGYSFGESGTVSGDGILASQL